MTEVTEKQPMVDCPSVTEVIAPICPASYPVIVQDDRGETFMAIITSEMKVGEIVRTWPETMQVFHNHGLMLQCGGTHTVAFAAGKHGFDLEAFLAELNAAVAGGEVPSR